MSDKLIDEAVEFLSSKSTSNPFQTAKENLAELKQFKEVEELDEMDKSQPSSSRGAEGLPLGKKADPVKTDKVKQDALKVLQKQYKKVNESSYNDDDHYAIHPDTGKVMDSWSKRDSRVNAVMSQQHKEKGHIIKTGRELNYAEYVKR